MTSEKLIKRLVTMSESEVYCTMEEFLCEHYYDVDCDSEYLLAHGTAPVVLVAHIDTVWADAPFKEVYHDKEEGVIWSPNGLGADDRAGIAMIIQLIKSGLRPWVLLTRHEEGGAQSARYMADNINFINFEGVKYFIELDRRGYNEAVFYNCNNKDFIDFIIKNYGFKYKNGTYSDISYLMPAAKICGVNLSCGYYNEHSEAEMLKIKEFDAMIPKVARMIKESATAPTYDWE